MAESTLVGVGEQVGCPCGPQGRRDQGQDCVPGVWGPSLLPIEE